MERTTTEWKRKERRVRERALLENILIFLAVMANRADRDGRRCDMGMFSI